MNKTKIFHLNNFKMSLLICHNINTILRFFLNVSLIINYRIFFRGSYTYSNNISQVGTLLRYIIQTVFVFTTYCYNKYRFCT